MQMYIDSFHRVAKSSQELALSFLDSVSTHLALQPHSPARQAFREQLIVARLYQLSNSPIRNADEASNLIQQALSAGELEMSDSLSWTCQSILWHGGCKAFDATRYEEALVWFVAGTQLMASQDPGQIKNSWALHMKIAQSHFHLDKLAVALETLSKAESILADQIETRFWTLKTAIRLPNLSEEAISKEFQAILDAGQMDVYMLALRESFLANSRTALKTGLRLFALTKNHGWMKAHANEFAVAVRCLIELESQALVNGSLEPRPAPQTRDAIYRSLSKYIRQAFLILSAGDGQDPMPLQSELQWLRQKTWNISVSAMADRELDSPVTVAELFGVTAEIMSSAKGSGDDDQAKLILCRYLETVMLTRHGLQATDVPTLQRALERIQRLYSDHPVDRLRTVASGESEPIDVAQELLILEFHIRAHQGSWTDLPEVIKRSDSSISKDSKHWSTSCSNTKVVPLELKSHDPSFDLDEFLQWPASS
ncbi:uncharacterized protein BJ171DRAFT_57477 [Polychytrium aggregatum]|uniref:uncharacterized protein n=1 Tax=Polychytrium aggregatum TaxID=110093 RepID=UPI0022FE3F6D|nr:uncharacterized protein BJ171DRAFT_57477 [Polychytrium aggregatum]KAI9190782.1 hypothetical protein BJ171DRAFT_57477 [Polychytrium aggregatum]